MKSYYVNKNKQSNGDHEVNLSDCKYFPDAENRKYLGQFDNCADAVKESKKTYPQSNGCKTCCPTCHSS